MSDFHATVALWKEMGAEIERLEAKLQAHLENEGDECPLCVSEAQVARLREALELWCDFSANSLEFRVFLAGTEEFYKVFALSMEALDD